MRNRKKQLISILLAITLVCTPLCSPFCSIPARAAENSSSASAQAAGDDADAAGEEGTGAATGNERTQAAATTAEAAEPEEEDLTGDPAEDRSGDPADESAEDSGADREQGAGTDSDAGQEAADAGQETAGADREQGAGTDSDADRDSAPETGRDPERIEEDPEAPDGEENEETYASSSYTEGDWQYTVTDGEAAVTSYTGDESKLVFPDTLGGYPVTRISGYCLNGSVTVTEVTIPETVKRISEYAFDGSKLEVFYLNCNLDADRLVEYRPFAYNAKRIVLGKNVETLPILTRSYSDREEYYFVDSNDVEAFDVDPENPYFTAVDGLIYSKDLTLLLRYPRARTDAEFTVPDSVTGIGTRAFEKAANLTKIHISDKVTSFGYRVFDDSGLQAIYAPEGSEAAKYCVDEEYVFYPEPDKNVANAARTIASTGKTSTWNGTLVQEAVSVNQTYTITTAAQLNWISQQSASGESFKGKTILLAANIDLNGKNWTPIGAKTAFSGSFDGQGHTVSGLVISGSNSFEGLFGNVIATANSSISIGHVRIKSVTSTADTAGNAGALIGNAALKRGSSLTVSDVMVTGTVKGKNAGGAIGRVSFEEPGTTATIEKVTSRTSVTINGGAGGGIVGEINLAKDRNKEIIIRDCRFNGTIGTSGRYGAAGGIAGTSGNPASGTSLLIEHCRVDGVINAGRSSYGGGIISGIPSVGKVLSCVNYADTYGYSTAGIAASNSGTIEECYNQGSSSAGTGAENGGLAAVNSGYIYNSYNGGRVSSPSALAYVGAISATGSGTIENCYNMGDVGEQIGSSVAVSHPGVFGYASGQTLIHSYFDNYAQDYIFGSDYKISTVVTDAAFRITESGGMDTASMKSASNYTGWDFANIWEFDSEYSLGYPTLTSVKDLLDKLPEDKSKNKLKGTEFTFEILDQDAEPVPGATITLAAGNPSERVLTSSSVGKATTEWIEGTLGIKVEKEGYATYSDPRFAMTQTKEIVLVLYDLSKADVLPLKSVIMDQDVTSQGNTRHLHYELLSQTRTINRQWANSIPLIPGTAFAPFELKASLVDPSRTYKKAELVQMGNVKKVLATAQDPQNPAFTGLAYDLFEITKDGNRQRDIYIILTEERNGQDVAVNQKINLVVEDAKNSQFELSLGKEIEITIPDSSPILPGAKLAVPLGSCGVTTKVTEDSFEIGINLKEDGFEKGKGFLHDRTLDQIKEDDYEDSLPGSIEKLLAYYDDPGSALEETGMGPVKWKWKVVGYGKCDIPFDNKVECRLYVELSAKIAGEYQVVYVGVVAVEGKGSLNGEFSMDVDVERLSVVDLFDDLINGRVKIGGEIGLNLFAGIGLANAASVGVYGGAALGTDIHWIGYDPQGFEEVYLDGNLSFAVRALGSNVLEIPVLEGRYLIYTREGYSDPASQYTTQNATNEITSDASIQVKALEALRGVTDTAVTESTEPSAGAWQGDSDTLQSEAYSSSAPVILTENGDRVMVFVTNTDTGRAPADRSMLVYSVYDQNSASWSEPVPVDDDGTADFNVSASGKYIVFLNAKGSLAGSGTYGELGKKQEVCIAEYSSASKSFVNIQTITDNDVYENRLQVTGGSDPVVTWTVDETGDIFGIGGKNTYYTAVRNGGRWNVTGKAEIEKLITSSGAGKIGSRDCIFYIVDEDKDLTTSDDSYLYIVTDEDLPRRAADMPVQQICYYEEQNMLFILDRKGDLYHLTDPDGAPVQDTTDGRIGNETLVQAVGDGRGNISLIMTRGEEKSRNAYIMRFDAASSAWNYPVRLTDQAQFVEGISVYYEDGELVYAYNQREVYLATETDNYREQNRLCWARKTLDRGAVSITDVYFYADDVKAGEDLPITVYIRNTGTRNLTGVDVRIESEDGNSVYMEETIETAVPAGSRAELEVDLPIPEDAAMQKYVVIAAPAGGSGSAGGGDAAGGSDAADGDGSSQAVITVGGPNYHLDKQVYQVAGHDVVAVSVTNTGFAAGSGVLQLYDTYDPDTIFADHEFKDLAPDEVLHYSFRPEEKGLVYDSLRIGMRIADSSGRVISESRQAQIWRDVQLPVSGVMLNITQARIEEAGDTVQLYAAVRPASAAEYATVRWESSDPDVASVDDSGLVTAEASGCALISVYSEDGQYFDQCLVYVGQIDLADCTVQNMKTRYRVSTSSSFEVKPAFRVVSGSYVLEPGKDYTYEYTNNTGIGTGHLIITGKGDFTGQIDKIFQIKSYSTYDKPDVTGIELSKHEFSFFEGESGSLQFNVLPADAGDCYVSWTSSDPSVASVYSYTTDAQGGVWINTKGPGTCTITANTRDGNYTAACEVTVKEKLPVDDVRILPDYEKIIMSTDSRRDFLVRILPDDAYNRAFYFETSDYDIASVSSIWDSNGLCRLYTYNKTGTAEITVYAEDGKVSRTFTVEVRDDTDEYTVFDAAELYISESTTFYLPDECEDITWGISDPSIAEVEEFDWGFDRGFNVEAAAVGYAVITATGTRDGKPFKAEYAVYGKKPDKPISYLSIFGLYYEDSLYEGETLQMQVSMSPTVPRDDTLLWSSSDTSVATVDEDGLVTGVSEGTVTITAKAVDGGVTASRELTVMKAIPLTGIELDPSEATVYIGEYLSISVNYIPEDTTYEGEDTWTSSDPDVASVYQYYGWVYGRNPGKATITCTTETGLTAACEVTVLEPEEIDLKDATVTLEKNSYTYTGSAITPGVTVTYDGRKLVYGTDYVTAYADNTNTGTAFVIVKGTGGYTGSVTKTFRILPGKTTRGDMFNLANNVKVTWKEVPGAAYYKVYREGVTNKSETQKDPVIVTSGLVGWDSQPGLTNGNAYRYKIVASLTGKGDSSGDSPLSYSKLMYRLKTVVIRSVKNTAPGKVTVKYDRTTSGDSYVLQYCERQDMVGAKTKVVLGAANTSYVIGGLKKGKTYYLSIRVRKKVGGIDYYTTFGVAKKVTITK